ncbi:MAG: TonB-dependent receptor, partial [Phycisphaerales bacterium]|nr:TonB-dependent receptor [Phycisphaerales bacterium]
HAGAQVHGDLTADVGWFARGEYVHTGSYNLDAGNRESESFRLVNARVGLTWRNVRVEGWIRNAFDDDYVLVAFQPDPTNPSVFVGESGAPQTLGATVSIEF